MRRAVRAYRERVMAVLDSHVQKAKGTSAEFKALAAKSRDPKMDAMASVYRVVAEHVELAMLDARNVGLLDPPAGGEGGGR